MPSVNLGLPGAPKDIGDPDADDQAQQVGGKSVEPLDNGCELPSPTPAGGGTGRLGIHGHCVSTGEIISEATGSGRSCTPVTIPSLNSAAISGVGSKRLDPTIACPTA